MISLVNVHKSFDGIKALDGLTLHIQDGSLLGMMGPGACGKSTLCKVICGLTKPDAGVVFLSGTDMVQADAQTISKIQSRLGVQFQNDALFEHKTVLANIEYPLTRMRDVSKQEIRSRSMEQLAMVGLAGFDESLPSNLSGGQRRRVALARACVTEPDILICDDPTAGLDPVTSRRILDMVVGIRYQAKNTVVIVSSDVLGLLSVSDRVALMWEGRIIAEDTPGGFRKNDRKEVRRFLNDAELPFGDK